MVKENGDFKAVSWEQALGLVAEQLTRLKGTYGPSSLAVFGSSKCTNEENYLLQRFARCVLGTNNVDNGSRLYGSAGHVGLGGTVGFAGTTSCLDDLEQSEVILVIGANPTSSSPLVGYAIKRAVRREGAKLLLIDPRQTGLASWAYLWLRPEVGTDAALISAMAKVIVEGDLLDGEYVGRKTDGFETLAGGLQTYTPEYVEGVTGISSDETRRAARIFAEASRVSIVYGNGITQHVDGTASVTALANLAMLTGNIGGGGGGIYALQRESNGQGACDMGALPDFLPGYQSLEDAQARKKFESRWGCDLPGDKGLTALEMIDRAREGGLRGMYVVGENPALSFPQTALVRETLASLDFLVVQDIFLTETARLATVVLPASSFAEKEGTFTNFEGRLRRLRKAVEPVGDSLPDWEIVLELAKSMGYPMPYSSPQQVMDEIEELVPKAQFASGPGRFSPVDYLPESQTSRDGYPFTLLAGTTLYQFGTGARTSRSSRLSKFSPKAFVEVSEPDAKDLGIKDGDMVKVVSPVDEVTAAARVTDTLSQGMIFMPMSFPESPVNGLFDTVLDPGTKTPALKTCLVRLERIADNG